MKKENSFSFLPGAHPIFRKDIKKFFKFTIFVCELRRAESVRG